MVRNCASFSRLQRKTARILRILPLCIVIPGALAAGYPTHPVRLIVPSPPGGGTDTSTRLITPKLSEILGQQIIVDNRGGASGNIGAEIALRAPPDGYTLLATLSSHASNPAVMKSVPYDLERDFAKFEAFAPRHRKLLGLYMWDYGESRPMPAEAMKHQCELGLKWLRAGRVEGLVFLASCIVDVGLEAVEYSRQLIAEVGEEAIG